MIPYSPSGSKIVALVDSPFKKIGRLTQGT